MKPKIIVFAALSAVAFHCFAWGFFGHKMINRLAVFTLPEKMFGFYREHIDYLTEHAVDPDKRRYSDTLEAPRHYIDLDYYETSAPVDTVPKYWKDAAAKYTEDTLKAYGIVPWHIQVMMYRLTDAFKEKDPDKILRNSAELGHYVADACVPLHATMNYNGQMSGQKGIHGFWESRLPELFSKDYDLFTGRAVYIDDVLKAAWMASQGSFAAKDSVLQMEKELNAKFPADKKYVLEQKGQAQVKIYAREYAEAYHKMLNGQVERRMKLAIRLVGSLWYTAWVNAGEPGLDTMKKAPAKVSDNERKKLMQEENSALQRQQMIGREE